MEKFVVVLILLISLFGLVPPMFRENELLFDNVYFSLLYLFLTYVALVVPFLFIHLNKLIARISLLWGGWFMAGLAFELMNFYVPDIVLNSTNGMIYNKFLMMFIIGISLIITYESWKQRKLNN